MFISAYEIFKYTKQNCYIRYDSQKSTEVLDYWFLWFEGFIENIQAETFIVSEIMLIMWFRIYLERLLFTGRFFSSFLGITLVVKGGAKETILFVYCILNNDRLQNAEWFNNLTEQNEVICTVLKKYYADNILYC